MGFGLRATVCERRSVCAGVACRAEVDGFLGAFFSVRAAAAVESNEALLRRAHLEQPLGLHLAGHLGQHVGLGAA